MGKASQRKGAQGERELAEILHDALGVDTRRGTILYGGSADVEGLPLVHVECKRAEKFSLYKAFEQSTRDAAKTGEIPAVFHRRNYKPWLVVMSLSDWLDFYRAYTERRWNDSENLPTADDSPW